MPKVQPSEDLGAELCHRYPTRRFDQFKPLLTAAEAYPALEELARTATRDLVLAFRVFDPDTPLVGEGGASKTWADLLAERLRAGVRIRVLLSDFDPIAAPELHRMTWSTVRTLNSTASEGTIEILPVRHGARVGRGLRFGFWIPALLAIERQRAELNDLTAAQREDAFATLPGLWRYLRLSRSGQIKWRLKPFPRLFPVTLHQKIAVADGARAILGGLDVDERRYDDPTHDRPAHETWHDVSVAVDGPVAMDIHDHVAQVWNESRVRMAALRREQEPHTPPGVAVMPTRSASMPRPKISHDTGEQTGIQLLRTISVTKRRRWFQFSPRPLVTEFESAHLELIRSARREIYIETQFFRSAAIADSLAAAGTANPDLNLVMILPGAPEDIAFKNRLRLPERMGEHQQAACIDTVLDAFGSRAAFLSPVRPVHGTPDSRDSLHGSQIIYVHAKVSIFDGRAGIVSSANLNGRSMRWDTEAGVLCTVEDEVASLRHRLMSHWEPDSPHLWQGSLNAAEWCETAKRTAATPVEKRPGLLVPYDMAPGRSSGVDVPGIPDELV